MRIRLRGLLCLLGLVLPLPASAQCALRYSEAFIRVPALGQRGLSQAW